MTGSVTFTPSEADYIAAMRANFLTQVTRLRLWVRLALWVVGAATVVAVLRPARDGDVTATVMSAAAAAAFGMLAVVVCMGLSFLLLPRRAARLFAQQKTLHREQTFTWDSLGTRWTSETHDSRHPWSDYHRLRVTDRVILLYLTDVMMQFIPRHALGAEAVNLITHAQDAGVPRK